MAIHSIQLNIDKSIPSRRQNEVSPYLAETKAIRTESNVKPAPPQGHLIHDNFANSIKYFFKDIAYDFKSVKNGFNGTANDHQAGRLNDVGLKLGGIGIATYLATQTTNPKTRLMEYIGLGTFLTSMSLYPKLAINLPARIKHGFDIDKEYIDDQGRKKSVMQDSNYVPYDMYLGEIPEEDLEIIGDRLKIPRDIKNRNDVIREQMRKISTQNNTLWMLTAGFATPTMTALLCCGIENYIAGPIIEKTREAKYNRKIQELLKRTEEMKTSVKDLAETSLSKSVKGQLSRYINKELPKSEFENIFKTLSGSLDLNVSNGIKEDLTQILSKSTSNNLEHIKIDIDTVNNIKSSIKKNIGIRNKEVMEKVFLPSSQEIETVLKTVIKDLDITKETFITSDCFTKIEKELSALIDKKIASNEVAQKNLSFFNSFKQKIVTASLGALEQNKVLYLTEEKASLIENMGKILGDFTSKQEALAKCKSFKFEQAPETTLARAYSKFEKTLLNEMGIKYKDLARIRESSDYAFEMIDKKFLELCKDENRFQKTMEKLGKIIVDVELSLHGKDAEKSFVKDLINAIENNYNNTAIRLNNLDKEKFKTTIKHLVQEDVSTLDKNYTTREQIIDLLDGTEFNKYHNINITKDNINEYVAHNTKGIGSSKNAEISRIVDRYQGARNSFNRILHALEIYKRSLTPASFAQNLAGKEPEHISTVIELLKKALLRASSSDHTLKLGLKNNPELYKEVINLGWMAEEGSAEGIKQLGATSPATKKAFNNIKNSNIVRLLERFQYYITRFRDLIANNKTDFTNPYHILNGEIRNQYTMTAKTNLAMFNLIGQSPVDMIKGAANRRYSTQKWVRIVSSIVGGVFGATILVQTCFGKLKNPENLQKKVQDV